MSGPPLVTVPLRCMTDGRGDLVALQPGDGAVPFAIERVYFIHAVPAGITRGCHAHRRLRQLMIAVSGSLDVILDDGQGESRMTLADPHVALYVPEMVWRRMENFAPGTVCVVLASTPYDEADYIRDYSQFRAECARRPHRMP